MRFLARGAWWKLKTFLSTFTPLKRGFNFFLDEFTNNRLLWSAKSRLVEHKTVNASSISEELPYLQICKLALEDVLIFNTFKSNIEYRAVLEHCSFDQGKAYLDLLDKNSSAFMKLTSIAKSDLGKPLRYTYKKLGRISPTQIRYAKIAQDLELLFGSLAGMKIAEIGVGYGGQANHILASNKVAKYFFYDLEWPGRLAIKYLETQKLNPESMPILAKFDVRFDSDLVISNYAFSELSRELQEVYLRTIVLPSQRGYFIYNHIHQDMEDSMTAKELISRVPGSEIFEEIPLTFPGNVLVVWGHNSINLPKNLFRRI